MKQIKEKRYPEEFQFEKSQVIDKIELRMNCIMNTIDSHIMAHHGDECIEEFKKLTYKSKIQYIENTSLMKIKTDKRLRMVGMTQSYNIDDSLTFKSNKKLKQILESNSNYTLSDKNPILKADDEEKNQGEDEDL